MTPPMHIQATVDQIIVENSIRLYLPLPDVEEKVETLRVAAADMPHGADFFNNDGSATFIWQRRHHRVTIYIVHGTAYELEEVPTMTLSSPLPGATAPQPSAAGTAKPT